MPQATGPNRRSIKPLLEVIGVFAAVIVGIKIMLALVGIWAKALPLIVPLVWIYLPIAILMRTRRDFSRYGLTTANLGGNAALAVAVAAIVIPLFVLGYYVFHGAVLSRDIQPAFGWNTLLGAVTQLVVIAFPEEIFFRGYVQSRLDDLFEKRWSVLGTKIGWSIVLTSLIFAAGHVIIRPHPFRAFVFFPSLLFGWMRERSGSVTSSGIFHGIANITVLILES